MIMRHDNDQICWFWKALFDGLSLTKNIEMDEKSMTLRNHEKPLGLILEE